MNYSFYRRILGLFSLLLLGLVGCGGGKPAPVTPPPVGTTPTKPTEAISHTSLVDAPGDAVSFADITAESGINWTHFSGARGKKYMPEVETPGCAFFDYDGDGLPDILLLNGADWPEVKTGRKQTRVALYHNEGGGKFKEVTAGSGLDSEMHTMGVAVGDYDKDGKDDLYITCILSSSRLFHNEGGGKFKDVTKETGVDNEGKWGSSAVWIDYDHDGNLDLVVGNYCKWTPETDVRCTVYKGEKSYCTPHTYTGDSIRLYHNEGNGKFKDVTQKAGMVWAQGKTWGLAVLDFDGDGWEDIAAANDMEANCLFHNKHDGTFEEIGIMAGIALPESGQAKAGMGIDAADMDNSGRESILVSNFSGEGLSLFHNTDGKSFRDKTTDAGMMDTSLLKMGWGLFIFDYDLDGRKDALVCNGHIYDNVQKFQPDVRFADRPLLYHNIGGMKFEEVAEKRGDIQKPQVARGCSYADIDGDGDLDVLIMQMDGKPRLLRNDGGNKNSWLRIKLEGVKSNRNGYGAKIEVTVAGVNQLYRIKSGSSFLSALEQIATIGLGKYSQAERVKITWNTGQVDTYKNVDANVLLIATEGKGAKAYAKQDLKSTPKVYTGS